MKQNGELTTKQQRMIAYLLTSRNIGIACKRAKVSRSTLQRWMQEPVFVEELTAAETMAISDASRSILAGQEIAITELLKIMTNPNPDSENTKRKACMDWLNLVFKYREYADILTRLEKLEEHDNERQKQIKET